MKTRNGFTLVELMIVVAVMAMLAAIAFPSYQSHILKGHRGDAQAHLMDLAQRQQQYLLDNRSYAASVAALGVTTPASVSSHYGIAVTTTAGPPAGFSIAAAPTGSQTSDSCGTLTITSSGAKSSSAGSTCW